ncbi:outer membrane beta-barrel protein [Ramlibacter sp. AW1]|uniref:Outer membrane beta-barrel protein n=1 Tax=Ramlibacter aurantiacus TaxID=2801330 RepID=A0A936ZF83_9BURK|nr:outer membrane beta-barrel protein [Ramlibacter aurantiacus]MBL0419188.1 outer membrane beta-barrel protein [Ramlibacter aurantiacus]
MKFTATPAMLAIAALAAMAAPAAQAQDTGWYAGGNVGRAGATIDDDRIRAGLAGQGLVTNALANREHDTGYKVFGGYQLNRNFAIEGGYFDLGEFGYTARTTPAGTLTGDMSARGLNLDVVGTLPLSERFSVLGRVGVTSMRTEGSFSATGAARVPYASANSSQTSVNAKWGVGVAYAFTESLSMRLEAERYRLKDSVGNRGDVDMVSVGLVYRFGQSSPATRTVAAAPVPAPVPAPQPVQVTPPAPAPAPAPPPALAPAPAPAVAAAPVVLTRVNLSADSLFDFDSTVVKPAGRTALDKLVADLRGVRYGAVRVTGHTDRLGSADYNARLSERRAAAVTDYMVQTGGLARDKVVASGAGETMPVTVAGNCRGASPTAALRACLQPDRRVEVEVHGTR